MRTRSLWPLALFALLSCGNSPESQTGQPKAPITGTSSSPRPVSAASSVAAPESEAAQSKPQTQAEAPKKMPASFDEDLAFLKRFGDVLVLESPEGGRVLVSAKYQGRVMTSAVSKEGRSLGWVNRGFIEYNKTGTQFDNYGGEDRFWLGPEGGQFGLYFPPGKPFEFTHWQTPSGFQEGEWAVSSKDAAGVTFQRSMQVSNHSGTKFDMEVSRRVGLIAKADLEKRLGISSLAALVKWVAFESDNKIKNTGKQAWNEKSGLVSVWILAMFPPASDMHVLVPFNQNAKGPIVNDSYFGKVPADRLRVNEKEGFLVFRCDGSLRSKIGLTPERAKNVLGSYSASDKLLTIVQYDKPKAGGRYVNSMWETQKNPFEGDVINSYNDGPTEPGKPALGGFYEMETSSPGAALKPGETLTHSHRTFHFVGDEKELDGIAKAVLGAGLSAFSNP